MALYENVFIARQDLSNTQAEGLIEHFSTVLSDNGGKVVENEYWGVKTMAYKINKNRKITVEFDGTVNSKLPWDFQPSQLTMEVVPGKMYDTHYIAKNNAPYAVVGNAAPSVTPVVASSFFNKTECFCFTQQLLKAGEQRDMPVRFVINPNLPEDVHTITLSYTFFINDKATALAKAPSTSPTARSAP